MATQILIQYNGDMRVDWANVRMLNTVTTAGIVSMTMLDQTVVVLKSYDSQEEAETAREGMREAIAKAVEEDGGTTIIIDIEDY